MAFDPGPGLATAGRITPAEVRGAVADTLIAGARGVIYFQHAFTGACDTHHALRETGKRLLRGPTIRTVRSTTPPDQERPALCPECSVRDHAPQGARHDGREGLRYMVKWAKGKFWVFAGADHGGGTATFSMRCIGNATAKVLWENRSIPLRSAAHSRIPSRTRTRFTVYRIDGGSSCRLKQSAWSSALFAVASPIGRRRAVDSASGDRRRAAGRGRGCLMPQPGCRERAWNGCSAWGKNPTLVAPLPDRAIRGSPSSSPGARRGSGAAAEAITADSPAPLGLTLKIRPRLPFARCSSAYKLSISSTTAPTLNILSASRRALAPIACR